MKWFFYILTFVLMDIQHPTPDPSGASTGGAAVSPSAQNCHINDKKCNS